MSEQEFQGTIDGYKQLLGEERIAEMNASLPTEPGVYRDGDRIGEWILTEDGRWHDDLGDSRPADWNFILVLTGFDPIKVD